MFFLLSSWLHCPALQATQDLDEYFLVKKPEIFPHHVVPKDFLKSFWDALVEHEGILVFFLDVLEIWRNLCAEGRNFVEEFFEEPHIC